MPQEIIPQDFSDVGHTHRHAGMARPGLLHCIHRKGANRIGQVAAFRR
jgi:hypothetical protein